MQEPTIPIVITQYGKFELTRKCIADLRAQKGVVLDIWLVDVASPGITEVLQTEFKGLADHYIQLNENVGFAAANNAAFEAILKRSGNDYVAILNNDTECAPTTFRVLYDFLDSHPKAAQVAPRLLYPNGLLQGAGGQIRQDIFEPSMIGNQAQDQGYVAAEKVAFVSGCAILMRSDALKEAQLFSDDYYMYSEDVDLSLTLSSMGYEVWYCPDAVVVHHESVASGNFSSFKGYYLTRSHVLLAQKFLSPKKYRKYLNAMKMKLLRQTIKHCAKPAYVRAFWQGFRDGKRRIVGRVA